MIIFVLIDCGGGKQQRVTLACSPSTDTISLASLVRRKLEIPSTVHIEFQTEQKHRIAQPTAPLSALRKQNKKDANHTQCLTLIAVLSGEEGEVLEVQKAILASGEKHPVPIMEQCVHVDAATLEDSNKSEPEGSRLSLVRSNVMLLNPDGTTQPVSDTAAPQQSSPPPAAEGAKSQPKRHPDSREESENDENIELFGIQYLKVDGRFERGYARTDVDMGKELMREFPIVTVAYPMQIVETVQDNERIRTRTYDKSFLVPSSVSGMDDATFSRYLSAALIHGSAAKCGASHDEQLALFPELTCVRHSCEPNTVIKRFTMRRPFYASCRAALLRGLKGGDEVVTLYPSVDSLGFLLLSKDRRQNLIKAKYHFSCKCRRCTRKAEDPIESTLTGAFFNLEGCDAEKQSELAKDMKAAFDKLDLFAGDGTPRVGLANETVMIPGVGRVVRHNASPLQQKKHNVELLKFIRAYSGKEAALQLHDNHWRLNLARAAYVHGIAAQARLQDEEVSAGKDGAKPFSPPKSVFDIAFKQLRVEGVIVPEGHPHTLHTYRAFTFLLSKLSDNSARLVQRTAAEARSIHWTELRNADTVWAAAGW